MFKIYFIYLLFIYSVPYTPHRRHDIESVVKVIIYFQCGFSIPKREQIKEQIKEPNKKQKQNKNSKLIEINEAKRKKEMAKKRAQQMLNFWKRDIYPILDKCWDDMLKLCRIGIKEEESEEEMDIEEKETQFEIINKIEEQLKTYSGYKLKLL